MTSINKLAKEILEYMKSADYKAHIEASDNDEDCDGEQIYTAESGDDIDVDDIINEFFKSPYEDFNNLIGKYKRKYVSGYTGHEGGGEEVQYIFEIVDTTTNETLGTFFAEGGYYSHHGTDVDDVYEVAEVKEEIVSTTKTTYLNPKGKVLYTIIKEVK